MSSNPADTPPATAKAPPLRRSWSLTARLAVLTAFSSFAILTVVSIQMYFLLATHLKEQNYRYLKDEAETLHELARFSEFGETLAGEMHVEAVGAQYLAHYVRLLDKDGRMVIETPNMEIFLPRKLFPSPEKGGQSIDAAEVRRQNGASFIVTSIRIDAKEARQGTLQVALDVTNVEKVLTGYRDKLAITLVGGFMLCAGAGLAVARRGTRSIREMTVKARGITASSLDVRLAGANWPTELNALAGALDGMLDRLQDSFKRMDIAVANLSHKLRTPLTILRGEAEVALGRERTVEELREVIESSIEEYERVSMLVDNIVLIAQAESGKLHPVLIKLKVRTEIDKVFDFYEPLADEKGIAVTCQGNAALMVDPTLFRKAFAKLLSNALTYTPTGGKAVVSVRQGDDRFIEVSVTDTGCGIAEQEIPHIFERFYRVYATRYTDPHGSGLGLPIVKTIMELHNGTIEVKSQPAQGTTVTLRFPHRPIDATAIPHPSFPH